MSTNYLHIIVAQLYLHLVLSYYLCENEVPIMKISVEDKKLKKALKNEASIVKAYGSTRA